MSEVREGEFAADRRLTLALPFELTEPESLRGKEGGAIDSLATINGARSTVLFAAGVTGAVVNVAGAWTSCFLLTSISSCCSDLTWASSASLVLRLELHEVDLVSSLLAVEGRAKTLSSLLMRSSVRTLDLDLVDVDVDCGALDALEL